jgi:NitT/TauT family transport system permease protein
VRHLFFGTTRPSSSGDLPDHRPTPVWADAWALLTLAALLFVLIALARQWTSTDYHGPTLELSLWALPHYALLSLARVLLAYLVTLAFAVGFVYWTSRNVVAGRLLFPLVEHGKRTIPVLGLLAVLAIGLLALLHGSNAGLELAALLTLVAGQFWPLTSGLQHAQRRVPQQWQEMAAAYHFTAWQRFRYVELPFALTDLVWGSMMAVARGWFLLMAAETLMLTQENFRLPGLGSYLAEAVDRGRMDDALAAVAAMAGMIIALDQLLWRPALAWVEQLRADDEARAAAADFWLLHRLRHSSVLRGLGALLARCLAWRPLQRSRRPHGTSTRKRHTGRLAWLSPVVFLGLLVLSVYGAGRLVWLLRDVSLADWAHLGGAALLTLGRVLLVTALATLWTVPVGIAVGLSPRLSRRLQPVLQVLASFPGPLLFPLVVAGMQAAGVPLGLGSVLLMLLAAQWYVFFNVAGAASNIPVDLREMVRSYRFGVHDRFRYLYLPAIFPQLVAGWDAACGAAWNASMVAEVISFRGEVLRCWGLGAEIGSATQRGDFARLVACLVVLAAVVGLLNRQVWGRCYRLAERQYVFNR